MAHPFMPLRARKLKKLTRKREDSNALLSFKPITTILIKIEPAPPKNQTAAKITTDNIISQL
jgi:hypothetical protein